MRFEHAQGWETRIGRALETGRRGRGNEALRLVVDGLRPAADGDASAHLRALCDHLEASGPETRMRLSALLRGVVSEAHVHAALTRSGIPGGEGFLAELLGRLGRRALPPTPDPTDLRDVVRQVFPDRNDHRWVAEVPDALWRRLLDLLGITAESVRGVDPELAHALRVLAHHAASLGLQPEVMDRLRPDRPGTSPFLELGHRVLRYLESFENDVDGDEEPLLDEALEVVARCRADVERLRREKRIHGTSLWLTALSFRLLRQLDRLEVLLHLTEPVQRDFQGSAVRLFKEVVEAERTRDRIRPHLKMSADLLALEVVEHAARKGSKYITSGRRDYLVFLLSSMGGGLIVAFFALAKVVMAQWALPLGIQALLYGINYSLCFVLIYLTGATLATKQPAMTANTLARSLGRGDADLEGLEDLIVRVWRSQFISFVGNLAVAFPAAYLLSDLFLLAAGGMVTGPEKAATMLGELHPWRSGTLAYAAMAGVLLFAAGLVSGWTDNWIRHRDIPGRVRGHPRVLRALGAERADRLATGLDRKLGAVAGNVFLGFGLGSLGTVGEILGLPLDIRHIAFASAELGMSLEVLGGDAPAGLVGPVALGVALIGLINFLVSFGLSLMVALESRRIGFRDTRTLLRHLGRRLWRRPLDWFFPPAPPSPRPG